jgi:hypothetical protein
VLAHFGNWWTCGGATGLIGYAISQPDRFRRLVILVVLSVVLAAFWRLVDDGALVLVLREIGSAAVSGPGGGGG